jgi:hypothetical protein
MKKIVLYFGDSFWCSTPYEGVALFYELQKDHEVYPVFINNDIRLHKEWRGGEKYFFDKSVFQNLPHIETDSLVSTCKDLGVDLTVMSCQMQFKRQFEQRNFQLKTETNSKILMFDIGGEDVTFCKHWDFLAIKGELWKKRMGGGDNICPTGVIGLDELYSDYDFHIRIPKLDKVAFCKKYDLDPKKPIIAYVPANPAPDNKYSYRSGVSASQALTDINNMLKKLMSEGYQVCFKTHPNDYITEEINSGYHGIHPRGVRGGYGGPRYNHPKFSDFTVINSEDGYNLYRNCDFGVTNYSHVGWEFGLAGKQIHSLNIKDTVADSNLSFIYTDAKDIIEMEKNIRDSSFTPIESGVLDPYILNSKGQTYKKISGWVNDIL